MENNNNMPLTTSVVGITAEENIAERCKKRLNQFQTFHERLAGVNIDVARKLGKFSSTPEDADTFFGEALAKWSDLNLTHHFVSFRRDIRGEFGSFVQLLHNQNEIVEALQKHLQVPDSLALQPLLDLLVQLARDLQADFYPYFADTFSVVVKLLSVYHHDVEILEAAFTCLAYLFKFMWRQMIADMPAVYKLFSPLLGNHHRAYITKFAAESFSFLMRKVKDKMQLLHFLFASLADRPDQAAGVGVLLFQMIKGVKAQFHSSTEQVLPQILQNLGEKTLPQESVLVALEELFNAVVQHTNHQYVQLIITCVTNSINEAHRHLSGDVTNETVVAQLTSLIKLLQVIIQYKDGLLADRIESIPKTLGGLLAGEALPRECACVMLDALVDLFLAEKCTPDYAQRFKLINQVYNSAYDRELLLEFTGKLFELDSKEKDLKTALESYCHKQCINETRVSLDMTSSQKPVTSPHLDVLRLILAWSHTFHQEASLDFSIPINRFPKGEGTAFPMWLCQSLRGVTEKTLGGSVCQVRAMVHCLPLVRPVDAKERIDLLVRILELSYKLSQKDEESERYLALLWETTQSLNNLMESKTFVNIVNKAVDFPKLIKKYPQNVYLLETCSVFYNATSAHTEWEHLLTEECFHAIWPHLIDNLTSPHHLVRKNTLDICRQFHLTLPDVNADQNIEQLGVFEICYQAESTEASVQLYRDKLMHLRKLDYTIVHNQIPAGDPRFIQVPLRYLLGVYYVNMRLIWEPIKELIASYATGLPRDQFWEVFYQRLSFVADQSEEALKHRGKREHKVEDDLTESYNLSIEELFARHGEQHFSHADRADHVHMRELLWTAMGSFPEVCEARSRLLSPLFFRFLKNEYYSVNPEKSKYISVKRNVSSDKSMLETSGNADQSLEEMEIENETLANEESKEQIDNETEEESTKADKKRGTASSKALVTHLSLFSKFRNPKNVSMEPKLKELYIDYLSSNDTAVQKVALACLMAYDFKYLTPYKENFERLLNDKQLRTALVMFGIDPQTTAIEKEHRPELMPLLMRILYGKLQVKSTKSSKLSADAKRTLIIRFLGGCSESELEVFLALLYEPVQQLLTGDVSEMARNEMKSDNFTKIVPLSKQTAVLSSLEVVIKKLGNLVSMDLGKLLRVLVLMQAQHSRLLDARELVGKRYINALKSLRQLSQTLIVEFFSRFAETYNLSAAEIEAVFEAQVWPRLARLHYEGQKSTTGLTALFNTWSHHSRYFPLLGKAHPDDPSLTPLIQLFKLFTAPTLEKKVSYSILELVENLLTVEDFEETEEIKAIEVGQSVPLPGDEEMSLGMRLILPHVTMILDYLKEVVQGFVKKRGSRITLPETELTILSKLSEYVQDEAQSETITQLLLPFLGRRISRQPHTEQHILTAVKHLLMRVNNPQLFFRDISKLFSVLNDRDSRSVLCDVLHALSTRLPQHKFTADVLSQMNSWDEKHVDDPDYIKRLDGFRSAVQRIREAAVGDKSPSSVDSDSGLDADMCVTLIHNCAFVLATTHDMSLRDNAGLCLSEMIPKIAEHGSDSALFRELVLGHILPLIMKRLKLYNETARHEFLNILAVLIKHFPEFPQFQALVTLRNYNDEESDIFTIITHVQLQRRAKGIRRLSKLLQSHVVKVPTLVNFLLPIIMPLLRDEKYGRSTSLRDAAVECVGAIARQLPWRNYSALLAHYLDMLTTDLQHQKLMVRVVVSILDAFHYDLSASWTVKPVGEGDTQNEERDVKNKQDTEKPEKADDKTNEDIPEMDIEAEEEIKMEEENDTEVTLEKADEAEETEDVIEKGVPAGDVFKLGNNWQQCVTEQATKIHKEIVYVTIPKMHKLLTKKAKSDDHHKMSGAGKFAEDKEVLRVPIALAMVRLLQALPTKTLQNSLPSILLKICIFLRSRAKDVRFSARSTLVQIVQALGSNYLHFIVKELISTLQRGYQLHVLTYTLWDLLRSLHDSGKMSPGDIDSCVPQLVQVLNEELFGAVSEEKDVEGITNKTVEAKSTKSYETYNIIGRYVTKATLPQLIIPLKKVCDTTRKHSHTKKASEALRRISASLVTNTSLSLETTLTFIYGIVTEQVPFLKPRDKKQKVEEGPTRYNTETFILAKAPERGGTKPKTYEVTNSHILVEFGLQVLQLLLKKSVIQNSNTSHLALVDPFIQPLSTCLSSKQVKVTITTLRCLAFLFRMPLPALKEHVGGICNQMFVLLNKYACTGAAASEDNFDLMQQCFKAMAVLVRDVQYHTIEGEQLKVLLGYADQDMHDYTRQGTAFTLLKAVLHRKLITPEMTDVIKKVQELSIQSEDATVRQQCRQVVSAFLMDYPVGNKLRKHLEFYIRQLEYEHEAGRQSALEMLVTFFNIFPTAVLVVYSGLFFVPLASRCVNDESAECKRQAQLAIKQLLLKLDANRRDVLFNMCLVWMQESKAEMRKLAALAAAPFVAVEASAFERHLPTLLPILEHQMAPAKYEQGDNESIVKKMDHLLFNLLNLLTKILRECDVIRNKAYVSMMSDIWESVLGHCEHAHSWVRLAAAQLWGLYLAAWSPHELLDSLNSQPDVVKSKRRKNEDDTSEADETNEICEYLVNNLEEKGECIAMHNNIKLAARLFQLHELCGAFCRQLTLLTRHETDLADQIVKNLVFIGKVLVLKVEKQPTVKSKEEKEESNDASESRKRNLPSENSDTKPEKTASLSWLLRKLCREAFTEAATKRYKTIVRTSVFKWVAAMGLELGEERIKQHLPTMLGPLVREFTDSSTHEESELKKLAHEVLELLKKVAGVEEFSDRFTHIQQHLTERRAGRKQARLAEVITEPQAAAVRKMKKNLSKRDAKKRKFQGRKPFKAKKHKKAR